jgi:hypothetical protein
MKKALFFIFLSFVHFSNVSALSCVDFTKNITRYQENLSVLALQNFLSEKGYLKVTPNAYFGKATFSALKVYQKSVGLASLGIVGPGTRAAIKTETCVHQGGVSVATSTTVTPKESSITTSSSSIASEEYVFRNSKRSVDVEKILQAFAKQFRATGIYPIAISGTSTALCSSVLLSTSSTSENVSLDPSVCNGSLDVSSLSPLYIESIPHDPSLASTSSLFGYSVLRDSYNDIMLTADRAEKSAIIKVTCNFEDSCSTIKHLSTSTYTPNRIAKVDRDFIFKASSKESVLFTISGKGFTDENTVLLQSKVTKKTYSFGTFSAADSGKIIVEGVDMSSSFVCGSDCREALQAGDYFLRVKNEKGTSNAISLGVKGFDAQVSSTNLGKIVYQNTKNVKLATITLRTEMPLILKSVKLALTSAVSKNLGSKVTTIMIKDLAANTAVQSFGGVASLRESSLQENTSKIYSIYADIGQFTLNESGRITYSVVFLVQDSITGEEFSLKAGEFSAILAP